MPLYSTFFLEHYISCHEGGVARPCWISAEVYFLIVSRQDLRKGIDGSNWCSAGRNDQGLTASLLSHPFQSYCSEVQALYQLK